MNSVLIFTSNIFNLLFHTYWTHLSHTHLMHTELSMLQSTHRAPRERSTHRAKKLQALIHSFLSPDPHSMHLSCMHSKHSEFSFSFSHPDPLMKTVWSAHFSGRSPSFLRSTLSSLQFSLWPIQLWPTHFISHERPTQLQPTQPLFLVI